MAASTQDSFLAKPTGFYRGVNLLSRPLAISYFSKKEERLKRLNELVSAMDAEIEQIERKHKLIICQTIAAYQDEIREHEQTTFLSEQISKRNQRSLASASYNAVDEIKEIARQRNAPKIAKIRREIELLDLAPEKSKHLVAILSEYKEHFDAHEVVYGSDGSDSSD